MKLISEANAKAPINLALIKYWGKKDEENIIPLNYSLSLTLDTEKFYTLTNIKLYFVEENKQMINDIGIYQDEEVRILLKLNEK